MPVKYKLKRYIRLWPCGSHTSAVHWSLLAILNVVWNTEEKLGCYNFLSDILWIICVYSHSSGDLILRRCRSPGKE